MPTGPSNVLKARGALGVATRRKDAAAIINARRNLAFAKVEAAIVDAQDTAPAFTAAQRFDLIHLITSGDAR